MTRRVLSYLALLMLLPCIRSAHAQTHAQHGPPETTLYVWAGDDARKNPDFLAVVNFDEGSTDYGKVLRAVPLPGPGNVGNEPHHCHLSEDGNILACGGLLSVLKGQNDIFFFDVSQARDPKLIKATRAPHASIIDDFYPLPGGGFLVSAMGSETGGSPGRILEFDPSLNLVKEWPENPPTDGFNPHGISVRPELNLMVSADFLDPITTISAANLPLTVRASIRIWNLERREIIRTVALPPGVGTMEVDLIPGDPRGRAVTNGMFDGKMYLIDPALGTAQVVFDYSTITSATMVPGGLPQLMEFSADGKRLFVPQLQTLLSSVDLGPNAGPHHLHLTHDGARLVVSGYFLNQDDFGVVHFDGDRKVHVLKVGPDSMTVDTRFQLDFNTAFPTGRARPHGIAMK
jgi:DNA-binding beta-propeller fold protein YncE